MQLFSANATVFSIFFFFFLTTKSWKNHPKKLHTYGSWEVFFSAAPTAKNSPELHFRFINYFIQPSRVGFLAADLFLVALKMEGFCMIYLVRICRYVAQKPPKHFSCSNFLLSIPHYATQSSCWLNIRMVPLKTSIYNIAPDTPTYS